MKHYKRKVTNYDYEDFQLSVESGYSTNTDLAKILDGRVSMNVYNSYSDPSKSHIRPRLYYSFDSDLFFTNNQYKDEIEFGEYPQNVAGNTVSQELERMYKYNKLEKTGKCYKFKDIYGENISKEEYIFNDKKYIRICPTTIYRPCSFSNGEFYNGENSVWIEVSPIIWYVDRKSHSLLSKNELLAGIYPPSSLSFLNNTFMEDIFKTKTDFFIYDYTNKYLENSNSEELKYCLLFLIFLTNTKDPFYVNNYKYLNELILNDKVPESVLCFIKKFDNWKYPFSIEAYRKILKSNGEINIDLEKEIERLVPKKDIEKQPDLKDCFDYISTKNGTIYLHCNNMKEIIMNSYKDTIDVGKYPLDIVDNGIAAFLDILKMNGQLKRTYKEYTMSSLLNENKYDEYILSGNKYVCKDGIWLEVLPIKWHVDKENNLLSINLNIHSSLSNLVLQSAFNKNEEINNFYNDAIKKCDYMDKEKMDQTSRIKELDYLEKQAKAKEERKQLLIDKIFKKIEELYEINDELYRLGYKEPIRANISKDLLLKQVEDHFEFNEKFISKLKYINLSLISSVNLKVSGIDFRGTNIEINPQYVYNKDLSYASFDDDNIVFKSFEGCNLCGTDLSNETESSIFDNAIINDETKLPYSYKRKLA